MADIRLITENPVAKGFQDAEEQRRKRIQDQQTQAAGALKQEAGQFDLDQSRLQAEQNQALTTTVGDEFKRRAETDPSQAFRASVAATGPEGSKFALQSSQDEATRSQERSDQMEELAITAAASGDDLTYQYATQQLGRSVIPQQLEADRASRASYARAATVAKDLYEGDPQRGQAFVVAFMATDDLQGSLQQAGPPADKPNWTTETLVQNGQRVLAFVDSNSQRVQIPTGAQGQPFEQPAPASAGGTAPSEQRLVEYLTGPNVGMDTNAALQMVFASKQRSPADAWSDTYQAVTTALSRSAFQADPAEVDARARSAADVVAGALTQSFSGGDAGVRSVGAPQPDGAPAPGVAQPTGQTPIPPGGLVQPRLEANPAAQPASQQSPLSSAVPLQSPGGQAPIPVGAPTEAPQARIAPQAGVPAQPSFAPRLDEQVEASLRDDPLGQRIIANFQSGRLTEEQAMIELERRKQELMRSFGAQQP